MSLLSVPISGVRAYARCLNSPVASDEEERSEHEAEHNRDRAVVLLHPRPQQAKYVRGSLRRGCIEAHKHENRYGEDQDHHHESYDASSRTEVRRSDKTHTRNEDRKVFDLDRE